MQNILKNILNKAPYLSLLFILLITLSSVSAVDINNSDDLGLIIKNAADGETINLGSGTYTNNVTSIVIDKNLTIQGKSPNNTIIDANHIGRIFLITSGNTLTLINLTLTNGNELSTGGIIYNEGSLTIKNSIFTNGISMWGGAIHNTGLLTIENSLFENNQAYTLGGAIHNDYSQDLNIFNSTFNNNKAPFGGAIHVNDFENIMINNCVFNENNALFGGAFYCDMSQNISIINSNFTNQFSNYSSGLYYEGFAVDFWMVSDVIIQGCNFVLNEKGIIVTWCDNVIINYNRFLNNTEYDLIDDESGANSDFNWWGANNPDMAKIIWNIPNNYFVMDIINITSLDSYGTVTFLYTFALNTGESANNSLLPYFTTNIYTNLTSGIIATIDARFNKTFDITINNTSGDILYTFITDNEIKMLEGILTEKLDSNSTITASEGYINESIIITGVATDKNTNPIVNTMINVTVNGVTYSVTTDSSGAWILSYTPTFSGTFTATVSWAGNESHNGFTNSINFNVLDPVDPDPVDPVDPVDPDPVDPVDPVDPINNSTNEPNNSVASVNMKKTAIPITIVFFILTIFSLLVYKRE